MTPPPTADPVADVRLDHLEQRLDRIEAREWRYLFAVVAALLATLGLASMFGGRLVQLEQLRDDVRELRHTNRGAAAQIKDTTP